jgi:hypothetical protein
MLLTAPPTVDLRALTEDDWSRRWRATVFLELRL